jgi:hypothetical protein
MLQAIDLESGIKLISTGIGSVLDGLEIQSLRSVSSSLHDVIQGNFTHGMQVFIKAEIENYLPIQYSQYLIVLSSSNDFQVDITVTIV